MNVLQDNNAPYHTVQTTHALSLRVQDFQNTEIGLIPRDWEVVNLSDISTLKARIGWQGLTTAEYLDRGDYYLVTGTDFFNGKIKWETCHYVDTYRYNQDRNIQLRNNDVLVTKDGTIGKIAYVESLNGKATLNSGVFVIRPKNDAYLPKYFFYVLCSPYFDKFLKQLTAGSTIVHLYQKDFINFKFPLPPLPEQIRIAEILQGQDALISRQEEAIEKQKMLKQATMQTLLQPKEGWEVRIEKKRLGDVCIIKKGQLITNNTRVDGEIPVIAGGKSPAYYHNKPNRLGKTITISASGASAGYVAYHSYPIFASDCSTIEESATYSIQYIFYVLQSNQENIYKMQTGGAQPHIHASDLEPLMIFLPPLPEQTRIATILSDIDAEIEAMEAEVQKQRALKEGLMQELLTGRRRLI